ncbi:HD domain-containing phosphohydrolase [Halarsenatibacter silvermanii]|uniref:Putative two-component system response regulator n=1 Tax=Halarsenatibacter silvermanii TaxID=321763 RepID=A0A1G9R5E9_9FIRM|nr:HD domain-containing phosphohydrolase [Halarsenatibacter silvermanii]SDM18468.1 putative two-component system response regulator [Halarsenatibacter silvermanii]
MSALYQQLNDKFSSLRRENYNKSSLVAVSHAIEDVVMEHKLPACMYVFFQKNEFFASERDRYLKLDAVCSGLYLFADEFSPDLKVNFSESTHFFDIKEFSAKIRKDLLQEWAVIVDHPVHSMALVTQEMPDKQHMVGDSFRIFKGNLFFEKDIVRKSAEIIKGFIRQDYSPGFSERNFAGADEKEEKNNSFSCSHSFAEGENLRSDQIIEHFLSNALQGIEEKVNQLANQNVMLSFTLEENEKRTREIVKRLCFAAEYRDEDTALHLAKIGVFSTLAFSLVTSDEEKLERMYYASLMHDVGKIGIPDRILFKSGKLTDEEYEKIKEHPSIAGNILRGSDHELIKMAKRIACTHHERWDGEGYPRGLAGEEIPLEGRIVAIVDVFDALVSERVYKDSYPVEKAVAIMKDDRNKHFDGELLDLFLENLDQIISYKNKLEANFAGLPENEVASHYFRLHPEFSLLSAEEIPQYEDFIDRTQKDSSPPFNILFSD